MCSLLIFVFVLSAAITDISGRESYEIVGCYADHYWDRDLGGYYFNGGMTQLLCFSKCQSAGYRYAGVQYGSYCFCGNSYGRYGPATNCDQPCNQDVSQICGGNSANYVLRSRVSQSDKCKLTEGGESFIGDVDVTETGQPCALWSDHDECFQYLPDDNLTTANNFCRNPRTPLTCHKSKPWCYTDNNSSAWEYCDIPTCEPIQCTNTHGGETYTGDLDHTISGSACVSWNFYSDCLQNLPDTNLSLAIDFCRNPSSPASCHREKPWCYVDFGSTWEYCDMPVCDLYESNCVQPLGMGDGRIADSQITASSYLWNNPQFAPYWARINTANTKFWVPYDGSRQFLHVDLLSTNRITKLEIQGHSDYYGFTNTFAILYSLDGFLFKPYSDTDDGIIPTLFEGNHGPYDINQVYFAKPFSASHVVLLPRACSNWCGLRMEIFGCLESLQPPAYTDVTDVIIQSDTNWVLANSPYIVRQPITVASEATLTIQAGVQVVFVGRNSGLTAYGCLQMNGIAGLNVQFLSNHPLSRVMNIDESGNRPFWQGILIDYRRSDCQTDFRNILVIGGRLAFTVHVTAIDNVEILNSDVGMEFLPSVVIDNMTITNSRFSGNQRGLRFTHGSSLNVSTSLFNGNEYGIHLVFPVSNSNPTTIRISETLFDSNNYGIVSDYFDWAYHSLNSSLIVDDCTFINHGTNGFHLHFGQWEAMIIRTHIQNCRFSASRVGFYDGYKTVSITNSTFVDSPDQALYVRGVCYSVAVSDSSFQNNRGTVIQIEPSYLQTLSLENNILTGSQGATCVNIYLTSSQNVPGVITFIENSFSNNSVSNIVIINDVMYRNVSFVRNTFNNPSSAYEVNIQTSWSEDYSISASMNWWGSANTTWVVSRIYDFYIDASKADVDISSVYADSGMTVLEDSTAWRQWEVTDGFIGGRLVRNETLIFDESTNATILRILKSILIPEQLSLEIHNAELHLLDSTGIFVQGSIVLNGVTLSRMINNNYANPVGIRLLHSSGSLFLNSMMTLPKDQTIIMNNSSLDILNCSITSRRFLQSYDQSADINILESTITSTDYDTLWINTGSNSFTLNIESSSLATYYWNTNVISLNGPGTYFVHVKDSLLTSNYGRAISLNLGSGNLSLFVNNSNLRCVYYSSQTVYLQTSGYIFFSLLASSVTSGGDSVYIEYSPSGGSMNFTNSYLQYRVSVYSVALTFTATNCTFACNDQCFQLGRWWWMHGGQDTTQCVTLKNNTFQGSSRYCVDYQPYNVDQACIVMEENQFINCKISIIFYYRARISVVRNNILSYSGSTDYLLSISPQASSSIPVEENNAVEVIDNIFKNNLGVVGIISVGCSSSYRASMRVERNMFVDNQVHQVVTSSCVGLYLKNNIFENPLSVYDFSSSVGYQTGLIIYAIENFWNATTASDVSKRIYDNQDNSGLALVQFSPWYAEPDSKTLTLSDTSFIRGNGYEIGGTLTEDLVLHDRGQPYIVVEDIVIPYGIILTLEAGVDLIFKQGGITVQGTLDAEGSDESPITMVASQDIPVWKGISFKQPYAEMVRQHKSGWWEILYQSVWYAVQHYPPWWGQIYQQTSDVLCRQAGYVGVSTFGEIDCSILESQNETSDNPCVNIPSYIHVACQGQEQFVVDCNLYQNGYQFPLLNLSCIPFRTNSKKLNEIRCQNGRYFASEVSTNHLVSTENQFSGQSNQFMVISPCLDLSTLVDCISIMSLDKPGWFIRQSSNNLFLEPKSNPTDPVRFPRDASFIIRKNNFNLGFDGIESVANPGWFVSTHPNNNDSSPGQLGLVNSDGMAGDDYTNASFVFVELSYETPASQNTSDGPTEQNSTISVAGINSQSVVAQSAADTLLSIPSLQSKLVHVRISNTSTGISIVGRFPLLDYVTVEGSQGNGITYSGYSIGNFSITNCNVSGSGIHGITYTGYSTGNFLIANCNVSRSGGIGVLLTTSSRSEQSHIIIKNSNIEFSQQQGIRFEAYSSLIVVNSSIQNNGQQGLYWTGYSDLAITNNVFDNNQGEGIYLTYSTQSTIPVKYNRISRSGGSAFVCSAYVTVDFFDNIISENIAWVIITWACDMNMRNNVFQNNILYTGRLITIQYSSNQFQFLNNSVSNNVAQDNLIWVNRINFVNISHNDFSNNTLNNGASVLVLDVNENTYIHHNCFTNPATNYEVNIRNGRDDSRDFFFDLSLNYWNRQSCSEILSRIYNFFNNFDSMPVNICPFNTKCENFELGYCCGFDECNGTLCSLDAGIGGEIATHLTISGGNGTYIVKSNIYVREYASLTIEPNVILTFMPGFGIYARGDIIIKGMDEYPVVLTPALPNTNWRSLTVVQQLRPNHTNLVWIRNAVFHYFAGMTLISPSVDIKNLDMSSYCTQWWEWSCFGLQIQGGNISIENTTFFSPTNTFNNGITLSRHPWFSSLPAYATVSDCYVYASRSYGMQSSFDFNMVTITSSSFMQNGNIALYVTGPYSVNASIIVRSSTFINNTHAVSINTDNNVVNFEFSDNIISDGIPRSYMDYSGVRITGYAANMILIQNNQFLSLPYTAVYVSQYAWYNGYYNSQYYPSLGITIDGNTFNNTQAAAAIVLVDILTSDIAIVNNAFNLNRAFVLEIVISNWPYYYNKPNPNNFPFDFSFNTIQQNFGTYIVRLRASSPTDLISEDFLQTFNIRSNVLVDNEPTNSVIYTDFSTMVIFNNVFSNPKIGYDLKVNFANGKFENCTENWWGSKVGSEVASRIYDVRKNSLIGEVLYQPFLNSSQFNCDRVSECSGNGICSFPQTCQCSNGWKGANCSQPSCASVKECFGRGQCIGPNQCRCNQGWSGSTCSIVSCAAQNNCSNHGVCVSPNTCRCAQHYAGVNCSECSANAWGPTCAACPGCVHGRCDQNTGLCICDGTNWAGYLCDTCAPKFFGSACLPLVKVFSISPTIGPDLGGTKVYFYGNNFPNVTTYLCRFDTTVVSGTWISDERVLCVTPQHPAGQVLVNLAVSAVQGFFTEQQLSFNYYAFCPDGACGNYLSPSHGYCTMGNCVCYTPWTGSDCLTRGLPPKFIPIGTQNLLEGAPLNIFANIEEGTYPYTWTLTSSPDGVIINSLNGKLQWAAAVASSTPYLISVSCSNLYGSDQITFNLTVPPSYTALLNDIPKGPFVYLSSVFISGTIQWRYTNSYLQGKSIPVNLIFRSPIGTRTIPVSVVKNTVTFYTRFFPYQFETGLTEVDARHPSDSGFLTQQSWSVYGLRIQTSLNYLTGYTGFHNYSDFVTITNIGNDPLTFVQLWRITAPFVLTILKKDSTSCVLSSMSCQLKTVLLPGQSVIIEVDIQVDDSYSGYFTLFVSTQESASSQSSVSFFFQAPHPVLQLSVNSISSTVTRGKVYLYQITVSNIGLRSATNIHPLLPNEAMLSVVSFGGYSTSGSSNLILDSGGNLTFILGVSPSFDEPIGQRSGRVSIASLETTADISYSFIVSSNDFVNLTVRVEDEYTYFAAGNPLLGGATVSLTSSFGGDTLTLVTTNSSDGVTFENIRENYYTLYTSASKHKTDSRTIFATGGTGSSISVFLQRIAVTYSWSVTPVPFQDEYDVTLQTTFETFVPAPVVVMTPTRININDLNLGLVSSIMFQITNYGLIAAHDFTFTLPSFEDHPFMHLRMNQTNLGVIQANSTVYAVADVVIDVAKQKEYYSSLGTSSQGARRRRSPGPVVECLSYQIIAVYVYICNIEHDNAVQLWIDNSGAQICLFEFDRGGNEIPPYVPYVTICWVPVDKWIPPGGHGPENRNSTPPVTSELTCKCEDSYPRVCFTIIKEYAICIVANPMGSSVQQAISSSFGCSFLKIVIEKVTVCVQIFKNCTLKSGNRRRRDVSAVSQEQLGPVLAHRALALNVYKDLAEQVFGDDSWFHVTGGSSWWAEIVNPVFSESSDGGLIVTDSEMAFILQNQYPVGATNDTVIAFVERLNNTFYNWQNGILNGPNMVDSIQFDKTLQSFKTYTDEAKQDNFNSIADWYLDAYNTYQAAESNPESGVCAKVRIQILQKITLTRTGFKAELILENGETSDLTNIAVNITIVSYDTNTDSLNKFAIGQPTLTGITNDGTLTVNSKGISDWLIIPYSSAAPTVDVQYRVGGTLYYTVGGESITVPLYPDTITVKPDPRLYVDYFLEKNVYADDPRTPEIESTVPFSLGILITNNGYGVASNLKIVSSQPQIIDNEKGLLIKFTITSSQLGNGELSPSLTVNFGDINPHSTKMARWIMTSTLPGTFSNYSATFQETNPLGNPALSVLDSVKFHELLHVVRRDYPSDDGIADYLTIDPHKLDILPDYIYSSENGTSPLPVFICNATIIAQSNNELTISGTCPSDGWGYFRISFTPSAETSVSSVIRSDGRTVMLQFNAWTSVFNRIHFLNLLDYIPVANSSYTYEILYSRTYSQPPRFNDSVYYLNVTENEPPKALTHLEAVDDYSDVIITYSLRDITSPNFPFTIDSETGMLSSTISFDYEQQTHYSVVVLAKDDGSPQLTGTTVVSVNVINVIDNPPVFVNMPTEISVEDSVSVGYVLSFVSVTDIDAAVGNLIQVTVQDNSSLFGFNNSANALVTESSLLTRAGHYIISIVAQTASTPPFKTNMDVVVQVVRTNAFAPEFNQSAFVFSVNEIDSSGTVVGRVEATDRDGPSEKLSYSINYSSFVGTLPFVIDQDHGLITNVLGLFYVLEDQYDFKVVVTDNGALPTGPRSSTANVTVHVLDVNDQPPQFLQSQFTVHVLENTTTETILVSLSATDQDLGIPVPIADYVLQQPNVSTTDYFKLVRNGDSVVLSAIYPLDRSNQQSYIVNIIAIDAGVPPLSSTATVTVLVDSIYGDPPVFRNTSATVIVPRSTFANTLIFTVTAIPGTKPTLSYVQDTPSSYIQTQSSSGTVRLVSSLQGTNITTINVTIHATDGKLNSNAFTLVIQVTDRNEFPPSFGQTTYQVAIHEETPIGTTILQLSATDQDSAMFYYYITNGNQLQLFSIGVYTGNLIVGQPLNYSIGREYSLSVTVCDGSPSSPDTLNDTTLVVVTLIPTNRYSPEFLDGSTLQAHVTEGKPFEKFLQVRAIDKDGDNITFSIVNPNEHFFRIDSITGWLSLVIPLNRSDAVVYVLQVAAIDDGKPPRTSTVEVDVYIDTSNSTANVPSSNVPTRTTPFVETSKGTDAVTSKTPTSQSPVTTTRTATTITAVTTPPAFDTPQLKGPTVVGRLSIEFACVFVSTVTNSNARFQVTFLFDGIQFPDVQPTVVSGSERRAVLHEWGLVGKLGKNINCNVLSFWATTPNQSSLNKTSTNSYWIGLQVILPPTTPILVSEADSYPVNIQLRSTLPITCSKASQLSQTCTLSVQLEVDLDIVVQQKGTSDCTVVFSESDWKTSEQMAYSNDTIVSVFAKRDPFVTAIRLDTLSISFGDLGSKTVNSTTYSNIWNNYQLSSIQIDHVDSSLGLCISSGNGHVTTFDGLQYDIGKTGQFVYVGNTRSSDSPFQIHVRHWKCHGRASCVCGIAVRDGNTIIGVDMCTNPNHVPHYITFPKSKLPSGYGVKKNRDGSSFQFTLPCGSKIKGTIGYNSMDIFIYVTADKRGSVEGLCGGSFDGDKTNDIRAKGSSQSVASINSQVLDSWLIPKGKSLFDGYFQNSTVSSSPSTYCSVAGSFCEADSGNNIDYSSSATSEWTVIIVRVPLSWTVTVTISSRKRRATSSSPEDYDLTYNSNDFEFEIPDNTTGTTNIIWPTSSGITYSQAVGNCTKVLWDKAPYKSSCSNSLSPDALNGIIAKCVLDVQISDSVDTVNEKLAEFANLCILQALSTNLTSQTNGTNSPFAIATLLNSVVSEILADICDPSNCNGNGVCTNGTCHCKNDYGGTNCAVPKSAVPSTIGLAENSLCDARVSSCSYVQLKTSNVIASDGVTCRIISSRLNQSYVSVGVTNATLTAPWITSCDLPTQTLATFSNNFNFSSVGSSGTDFMSIPPGSPVLLYNVSVSNDAKQFSNQAQFTVYDSTCYSCLDRTDNSTCKQQAGACLINGYCFSSGSTNPYKPSEVCKPTASTSSWTSSSSQTPGTAPTGPSVGAVVGGVLGGLAVVAILAVLVFVVFGRSGGTTSTPGAATGKITSRSAAKFGSNPASDDTDGSSRSWPKVGKLEPANRYSPAIYGELSGRKSRFFFINFKRNEI